jgi:hypothetical protein
MCIARRCFANRTRDGIGAIAQHWLYESETPQNSSFPVRQVAASPAGDRIADPRGRPDFWRSHDGSGLADNDFADLNDRRLIRVVGNVGHDFLR